MSYDTTTAAGPLPAVILWDTATGAEVSSLVGPPGVNAAPVFSPDGQLVASVSYGGRVSVWGVESAAAQFSFEPAGGVNAVDFLPDGRALVVAEPDGERVGFYSVEDGHLLDELPTPGFSPQFVAPDPTGRLLAVSSQASLGAQVFDLQTRRLLRSITTADGGPVDWSPQGDRLAIAGANASPIRIVDAASGEDVTVLLGTESGSWDVAFAAGGDRLASVGQTSGLRVWDVTPDGAPSLGAIAAPPGHVHSFFFTAGGSEIVVSTRPGTVERLSTDTGQVLGALPGQMVGNPCCTPHGSGDGRFMATVDSSSGRATIRDTRTLAPVREFPECANPHGLNSDGSRVVLDGRVLCMGVPGVGGAAATFAPSDGAELRSRVVDVGSGEELLVLGERVVLGAAFNPPGRFEGSRYVALNVGFEVVEIYDVATRELLTSLDLALDGVLNLVFDPQGRWLAFGSASGRVGVIDLAAVVAGASAEDSLIVNQVAHEGSMVGQSFTEDGILATAPRGGGLIRFWDIATGERVLELRTDPSHLTAPLLFSPDGSYLLYNDGGVLRRYPLDNDALIELAHSRLTREFTVDECQQYLGAERCP